MNPTLPHARDCCPKRDVKDLSWERWAYLAQRGRLRRKLVRQHVASGQLSKQEAQRLYSQDRQRARIQRLIDQYQIAEHRPVRRNQASMSLTQIRVAIAALTPLANLSRQTWLRLKRRPIR